MTKIHKLLKICTKEMERTKGPYKVFDTGGYEDNPPVNPDFLVFNYIYDLIDCGNAIGTDISVMKDDLRKTLRKIIVVCMALLVVLGEKKIAP